MNTSKRDIFWTFVFLLFAFILQVAITSKLSHVIKDVHILADFLSFTQILMIIAAYTSLGYDLSVDKYVKWFIQRRKFSTLNSYINLYVNIIMKMTVVVIAIILLHYTLIKLFPWLYEIFNDINFFYCNFVFIGIIVIIVNIIYFTGRVIRCYIGSKYYVLIAQLLPFLVTTQHLFMLKNNIYHKKYFNLSDIMA
jgi:hypothetical protein